MDGRARVVRGLEHAYGHFSDRLPKRERKGWADELEAYRHDRCRLAPLLERLRGWVDRFDDDYFRDQTLFEPYPREFESSPEPT